MWEEYLMHMKENANKEGQDEVLVGADEIQVENDYPDYTKGGSVQS